MDEIINNLQYITFPLELVGFTLAFIEIRSPALSQRLGQSLMWLAPKSVNLVKSNNPDFALSPRRLWLNTRVYPYLGLASLYLTLSALIFIWASGAYEDTAFMGVFSFMNHWSVKAFSIIGILWIVVPVFLAFAVSLFPGRELGTTGLLLAFLGLMGEAVQFAYQIGQSA